MTVESVTTIDWRRTAYELWRLLDDIDTLDDACRENDAAFRKLTYAKQRKRFGIIAEPIVGELYDAYGPQLPETLGSPGIQDD